MLIKTRPLLIPLAIFLFVACTKITPTGFWNNYKSNLLIKNISDQGPYGGHRAMYWEANQQGTFSSESIINFATNNGWKLTDSSVYNTKTVTKWLSDNQNIFPLTGTGFDPADSINDASLATKFPRWINSEIKVYIFKTGWVTIEPGNASSFEENGFAIVNNDGTKFSVYHLWGE